MKNCAKQLFSCFKKITKRKAFLIVNNAKSACSYRNGLGLLTTCYTKNCKCTSSSLVVDLEGAELAEALQIFAFAPRLRTPSNFIRVQPILASPSSSSSSLIYLFVYEFKFEFDKTKLFRVQADEYPKLRQLFHRRCSCN